MALRPQVELETHRLRRLNASPDALAEELQRRVVWRTALGVTTASRCTSNPLSPATGKVAGSAATPALRPLATSRTARCCEPWGSHGACTATEPSCQGDRRQFVHARRPRPSGGEAAPLPPLWIQPPDPPRDSGAGEHDPPVPGPDRPGRRDVPQLQRLPTQQPQPSGPAPRLQLGSRQPCATQPGGPAGGGQPQATVPDSPIASAPALASLHLTARCTRTGAGCSRSRSTRTPEKNALQEKASVNQEPNSKSGGNDAGRQERPGDLRGPGAQIRLRKRLPGQA